MGDPEIGSTLGGYRLEEVIGRGGMGVVYRATQLALDRDVALKVIARHLSGVEGFRERFLRESRLAARLDHPGFVPVLDVREEEGELIVVMKLIGGGDLRRRIREDGPLPPAEAIDLLAQVAAALDTAHAEGIVHRDVKPHNILLEDDRAYLTDFGLAKAVGDSGVMSSASIVGTVEYMSPEQWRGREVGPPADVYSLGCVLYEAVTGIAPFARRAGDAEPQMPAGLDSVIERAVAKDPARRYASAGALIEAAREHQSGEPAATRVLSEEDADLPTAPLAGPFRRKRAGLRSRLRLRGGLVTAAILAAFVAALVLLLGDDEVSVSDPVRIGSGALRLAADGSSVWATSGADGSLVRIDPESGAVRAKVRLDRGISAVALGAGHVWVSSPRRGELLRVDPEDRSTLRIPVGGTPGAIAVSGGRVWVADQDGRGVSAVNPAGGKIFKRGIRPHAAPLRLTAGAGGVWASSATTGSVRRIDRRTAGAAPPIRVGRGPAGVTVGGGLVWIANSRSDAVTRLDPATGSLLGDPIEVGSRPGGIDAGTNFVWVANNGDGTVSRIEIEGGEVVGEPIEVGSRPGAVAVGREAVWVANNGDGTVTRIEP